MIQNLTTSILIPEEDGYPGPGDIMNLEDKIKNDIKNNPIMLYMKGTKLMPMCGFSATVVNILNSYGVKYESINILEDPEIRIKLSEYSDWPTIPQLFVNGELIGGCDIAMELHNNGELKEIFEKVE